MFEKLEIFRQAHAMAQHASARQTAISRNVANADTPGYRSVDLAPFSETYRAASGSFDLRTTRHGHVPSPSGIGNGQRPELRPIHGATAPNGNDVSIEAEMMRAADVRASHDMALSIYQNAIGILRTSLGRAR